MSAAAGSGKSTLLATWAGKRSVLGERVAWVSLDAQDDDPRSFWSVVLLAAELATEPHERPAARAVSETAVEVGKGPLLRLEAVVTASDRPLWLFLDDFQQIHSPEVLGGLDALLRAMPDGLHLVIASRHDPALALHRLLVSGRLNEIRAAELALDAAEIECVLRDHDVSLDRFGLALLAERTEGWAAGVRLAALALSVAADPEAVLRDMAADDRAVADYLAMEVLGSLVPEERAILRACAVPDEVTADLALHLTGDRKGAAVLEKLYRRNVLVTRVAGPGRWYRIHGMLRAYLLAELQQSDDELLRLLHARSAHWFVEHGRVAWALTHAMAAGHPDLTASMFADHGPTLLATGQASVLRSLIASAGPGVRVHPDIRRLKAIVDLELDHRVPEEAQAVTRGAPASEADPSDPSDPGGRSAALGNLLALEAARLDRRWSPPPVDPAGLVTTEDHGRDLALLLRQNRAFVLTLAGRLEAAETEMSAAHHLAVDAGNPYAQLQALAGLVGIASCRCDFGRSWEVADEAMRLAARIGQIATPAVGTILLEAAHAAYERLDHQGAYHLVLRADDPGGEPAARVSAAALVAALDVQDGRSPYDAARRLRDSWAIAASQPLAACTVVRVAIAQHRCSWLVGRPDWARESVDRVGEALGSVGDTEVLIAAEHVNRGRGAAARRRIAPVLDGSTLCLVPLSLQHAWLTEAVLAAAADEPSRSFEALREAVVIVERTQAQHAFLDVPGVPALLVQNTSRFGRLYAVAERLRRAVRTAEGQRYAPLTPKELMVLEDLPAQLTLDEIAELHQVSVNTVKTHVRAIYQKLNASSRREAVSAARWSGLL